MTGYAYLFEAKGVQRYIFGSGRLRDVIGASDLLARIATCDGADGDDGDDLVGHVIQRVEPDQGFSRRGAGSFCAHFAKVEDRDRFRALWRLTLSTALPGLEFTEGLGEGETDEEAITRAYRSSGSRANSAASVLPLGGPATAFAARTGRPAVPVEAQLAEHGQVDAVVRPARRRSYQIDQVAISPGPDGLAIATPDYGSLLRRTLPRIYVDNPSDPGDGPPLLIPRNLTDDEQDRIGNPLFAFAQDVDRLAMVHIDLSGLGAHMVQACKDKPIDCRLKISTDVEEKVLGALRDALAAVMSPDRAPPACETAAYWTGGDRRRVRQDEQDSAVASGRAARVRVAAFRPIVAGGDDLTVMIGSEFAVPFAHAVLKNIDESGLGLSACAGVALVKATTPSMLAHALAEGLVSFAKKAAKARDNRLGDNSYRSALAFHSPIGTLGEDYEDVWTTDLLASGVRLTAGPYWVSGKTPIIADLEELCAALGKLRGRGALRAVRSTLDGGLPAAEAGWRRWRGQCANRRESLDDLDTALVKLGVTEPKTTFVAGYATPLFDALTLLSLSSKDADTFDEREAA